MVPLPLQFVLVMLAGWVNRQQQEVIGYLEAENRVLREQLGPGRLRFTDAQRSRLARAAHPIGRKVIWPYFRGQVFYRSSVFSSCSTGVA